MRGRDAADETFDFLIVGGGTAGCVLANRLSENPRNSVCLLESGPEDRHPYIHVPVGMVGLINHPKLGWGYASTPQPGLGGREIPVPRGRMLGGSGGLNGMVYTRGHRRDYDDWRAAGNVGWGYDDVLPYFRRSEDNLDLDGPFHAKGGPFTVATAKRPNPLAGAFLEAAVELGFARNDDINGAEQDGFGLRQVNILRGARVTTATAFLRPARRRPNLRVMTGADVSHVTIEDGRAIGVQVCGRIRRTVRARREVVLAAGAFGSPAILMRSGIGPGEDLLRLGIPVVRHRPDVGQNLADHPSSQVVWEGSTRDSYGISLAKLPQLAGEAARYVLRREGMFASNIFEAAGYVRTLPHLDRPDVQLVFCPALRKPGGTLGIGHGFSIGVVALHPVSTGSVRLSGARMDDKPLIDFGLFSDSADVATIVRGLRIAKRLAASRALARYGRAEIVPGPEWSDADLGDFVRHTAATAFHPVGTCRMGADPSSVVDPELRVRGVSGLSVADASIMPSIVGGNTNAPAIMIAEKASDLIAGRM
ncbi:GMC family oxidoreductase [Mesorhizobium australicum]|uniref:Choline dehydrogenase n=1 Tax=Mesorhizobium australicum TaxID=536018 RepID=A0A1X7PQQ5_9HYPH|nr:GMC family oxidoreductase N-terminal domain-containing protein [Mesorhizobium australicum]SMH54407.1 Choline dehydrogenase [Mesorhizobium australicum]